MEEEDIKELFDSKYEKLLGITYEQWVETGPTTEEEAYARLQFIDDELKQSEEEWQEATGREKDELEEYRDRLRSEYQLIEERFGFEPADADW